MVVFFVFGSLGGRVRNASAFLERSLWRMITEEPGRRHRVFYPSIIAAHDIAGMETEWIKGLHLEF
jgi:hypothetical protein